MASLKSESSCESATPSMATWLFCTLCALVLFGIFLWIESWQDGRLQVAALAGIVGVCFGSFANVVIWRLPVIVALKWETKTSVDGDPAGGAPTGHVTRFSLAYPPSTCPVGGCRISAWHNVPVLSYLVLRARCAHCNVRISPRYPLVELLMGVAFAALGWLHGATFGLFASALFFWIVLVLLFIDWDTQLLPDVLTQPLLWLGLLANAQGLWVPLEEAVVGAALGYATFWLIGKIYTRVAGNEGMGQGDYKLTGALCAWMGWAALPWIMGIGAATSVATTCLLVLRGKADWADPQPFGPHLILAGLGYWFFTLVV